MNARELMNAREFQPPHHIDRHVCQGGHVPAGRWSR